MPWIESHTVLLRHRKLRAVSKELGLKPVHLMGHLHALWHTALEQQEDGDLATWDDDLIADAAAFEGDASKFVASLRKHRFLGYFSPDGAVIAGSEKLIHDWLDYAGKFLTSRYSSSNRSRLIEIWARHRKAYGEAKGKREESEQEASGIRPPPNPTQPNPPTHQPNPTYQPNLTHPTQPTAGGLGLGEGAGGNGSGRVGNLATDAAMKDAARKASLYRFIESQKLGLNPKTIENWMDRKDVTSARLERELSDIRKDARVDDVAGVLVARINGRSR